MPIKFKNPEHIKLGDLRKAFSDGNPLAVHEAIAICRDNNIPPPKWVADAMQTIFVDFYSGNVFGKKGKGNSVLGGYMKLAKGFVRKQAYLTVRKWHENPNNYHDMPRRLILDWFDKDNPVIWPKHAVVEDALRHAHIGLRGTAFAARMSTIRQARSMKIPASMSFGEMQAEIDLGLRDQNGIFGAHAVDVPGHLQEFLDQYASSFAS